MLHDTRIVLLPLPTCDGNLEPKNTADNLRDIDFPEAQTLRGSDAHHPSFGQSGVERGAYRAAIDMGLPVAGFMPGSGRDEFGRLSSILRACLEPSGTRGFPGAVLANIGMATAALIVVPEVARAHRYTGIENTLKAVRAAGIPLKLCDPSTDAQEVLQWVGGLGTGTRLMVHGPRKTRWTDGEAVAWKLVATIAVY